jgi:hypothetical protein
VGLLLDFEGNDNYTTDIFGQGTAYWYSLGVLNDGAGDDQFQAHQYAQGAGVHLAHGLIWDVKGNDKYRSHGVSQGCGHDLAGGFLLDQNGDDEYTAFGLSQGGGNADAVSLFIDVRGDDAYVGKTPANMMGYSDFRRDYGMIGVFADGGGNDRYSDTLNNNRTGTKSTYGVFADFSMFSGQEKSDSLPVLTPPESLRVPLASTVDSLFIQASAAPQKFQYNVGRARDTIIARGTNSEVMSFLAGKLNTQSARERHALRHLLEQLHEKDSVSIARLLSDSLRSSNRRTKAMCADVCGRKKISLCLSELAPMLKDTAWTARASAAWNIGRIGRKKWPAELRGQLKDKHPHVRMRAAYGLGLLFPENLLQLLPEMMDQKQQLIRNSLIQGIIRREKEVSMKFIRRAMHTVRTSGGKRSLTLLIPWSEETKKSAKAYKKLIKQMPKDIRRQMYLSIVGSDSGFWKSTARKYRDLEPIEDLRRLIH